MSTDLWQWRAVYDDGTFIDEYDEAGQARGFLTIERERVSHLVLLSRDELVVPHHVIKRSDPESTIHFRRRRQIATSLDTGDQTTLPTVTIVGLERAGMSLSVFFFEDGSTLTSDNIDAV